MIPHLNKEDAGCQKTEWGRLDVLAICLLTLGALALCAPMLFQGKINALGDNLWGIYPRYTFFHSEFRQLNFPLWNPQLLAGVPGDTFVGPSNPLYPPLLLSMVFENPVSGYHFFIFEGVWLTAIGFYNFAKFGLNSPQGPAFAGAILFSLNGLVAHTPVFYYHHLGAWIPLILMAAIMHIRTGKLFWIFLKAFFWGIQWTFLGPQYSIFSFQALFLFWIACLFLKKEKEFSFSLKKVGQQIAAMILGTFSCLLILAPFAAQIQGAERAAYKWRTVIPLEWTLPNLIATFIPNLFGSFFNNTQWAKGAYLSDATCYFGVGLIVLIWAGRKNLGKLGIFFLLLAIYGCILSFGGQTPLGLLVHNLPLNSGFSMPGRYWVFGTLGCAAAITLILKAWENGEFKGPSPLAKWGGIVFGISGVLLFLLASPLKEISYKFLEVIQKLPSSQARFDLIYQLGTTAVSVTCVTLAASLFLLANTNKFKGKIGWFWGGLLAVSMAQLWPALAKYESTSDLLKTPAYAKWVKKRIKNKHRYWPSSRAVLGLHWPFTIEEDTLFGLTLATGYLHFHPLKMNGNPTIEKDCRFFATAFVSNLVALSGAQPGCQKGKSVAEFPPNPLFPNDPPIEIFEIQNALPIAFLSSGVKFYSTNKDALNLMRSESYNPRNTVLIDTKFRPQFTKLDLSPQNDLIENAVLKWLSNNRLQIKTNSKYNRVLTILNTYFEGWTASINNHPAIPVSKALAGFQALPLPKGNNTIVLEFKPVTYFKLIPFCLFIWGIILGGMAFTWKKRWVA